MNQRPATRPFSKLFSVILLLSLSISSLGKDGELTAQAQPSSKDTKTNLIPNASGFSLTELSQDICIMDGTVQVSIQERDAIATALVRAVGEVDFHSTDCFAPIDRRDEQNWTFITLAGLQGIQMSEAWTMEENGVWMENIIIHNIPTIHASVAGTLGFSQELTAIPIDIVPEKSKLIIDPLANKSDLSALEIENLRFPLELGYQVFYGTKDGGVHPGEFIFSGGMPAGSMAVDLMSDGNIESNHAPNRLYAAASGTVVKKCSDTSKNSTYIIVDNGTERFLYAHIKSNTAPGLWASLSQGAYLGEMVPGTFNDNPCGYASQTSGFFHVHFEFPGTAYLTLSDWTLNTSTEKWQRGSEVWQAGEWKQVGTSSGVCPAPSLNNPADGHVSSSQTVSFSWSAVSGCTFNGYTFRVNDSSNMDDSPIIDQGEGGTSRTETFGSEWNNRDLWWGVKAANAPNGASWSVRRFRIEPGGGGCPSVSGIVRLYDLQNCGTPSIDAGLGLLKLEQNNFNDKAESIAIPSGWSARLYQNDNENTNESRCFSSTDTNLNDNTFENGGQVGGQATWVRVYNNSSCIGDGTQGNWNAKYFNGHDHWWDNNNFNNQMCEQNFSSNGLDRNYGSSAPCNNSVSDNWVAEYNASINFSSGSYVFYAQNDDGLKVWVNGSNIMERGGSSGYSPRCPALNLSGNVPIRAILREEGGDARVRISWTTDTSVCNLPGSFNKISPPNGAANQLTNPTLSWENSSGANDYSYCIDTSNNNNCDTGWQGVGNVTSKSLSGLNFGTPYYWQVRAHSYGGETYSNGNTWWSFTTQPEMFTLTVNTSGTGSGTVTSNPVGINCGVDCSEAFTNNTQVTLTATPAVGSTFAGWSGDADCSDGVVTMNVSKSCTATFNTVSCPTVSGLVRLYDGTNCNLLSVDVGLGLSQLESATYNFNDKAESIVIPSGWSARLYQNDNENTNESVCFNNTDTNLNDNTYANGGTAGSSATWVRVYSNSSCIGAPPGAFNKISPPNGATNQPTNPTLSWEPSTGATSYEYCYDTTDDNACSNWTSNGTSTSKQLSGLYPGVPYFWHVRAQNTSGTTYSNNDSPTAFWKFTTQPNSSSFNLLMNAGFEDGSNNAPAWWNTDAWTPSYSSFIWDTAQKHSGSRSIKIANSFNNDVRWIQTVYVQPNSDYLLSGWIKTQIVNHSPDPVDAGANLSILGALERTDGIFGTTDWTYVSLLFNSGSRTQVDIAARLGMYSGTTTGIAWFDDLKLELLSTPICYTLTKNVSPAGSGSVSADPSPNCNNGTQYIHGTVVKLTAVPNTGYSFGNWSGGATGSTNPIYLTMNSSKSVTANFNAEVACPTITAWKGEYWANTSLSGSPTLCRNDVDLDFDWELGSPDPLIPSDNFSARWTRTATFNGGTYRFHFRHDDGARFYIDNVLQLDVWDTCCVWETVEVELTAGAHELRMDYFENGGAAHIQLWWEPIILVSIAAHDGWILESSETSGVGGTLNSTAATLRVGDDAANKHYRSILSFDTSSVPEGAVITSVTLKFKPSGFGGTNPFNTHGNLLADMCWGAFRANRALQLNDFNGGCPVGYYKVKALIYASTSMVEGWYTQTLLPEDFGLINLGGVTQFRLRFAKDDNNDRGADFLKIYSGNALTEADRPQLVIEYYVP